MPVDKRVERVPERIALGGQLGLPTRMTLGDGAGAGAVLKVIGLRGEVDLSDRDLEAARSRADAEGVEHQLVQQRRQRDLWTARHCIAQRQRTVRRQLRHQAFGKGPDAVLLLRFVSGRRPPDGDDGPLHRRLRGRTISVGLAARGVALALRGRSSWHVVLRSDVTTLDPQPAVMAEANEGACAGDLGRIVAQRAVRQLLERCLDLAEPVVDRLRQFVLLTMLGDEPLLFGRECVDRRLLRLCRLDGLPVDPTKAELMTVGEAHRGLDPLPALGRDVLGLGLQLLGREAIEKRDVLEPAAAIGLEQVAQHGAPGRLIGVHPDEQDPFVRRLRGLLGQEPPDLVRLLRPGIPHRLPDLLLAGVIVRDGEGHELLERHAVNSVDLEQRGRDRCEAQPLLDHVDRHEEGRGDSLLGHAFLAHRLEGAELVEGMERRPLDVLGQRDLLDEDAAGGIRDDAGYRCGLHQPLLLHQEFESPVAPAASRHLVHPGLPTLTVEHRPNVQALDQAAPADGLGEVLDRQTELHAPDVRLAQHQLVEGDRAGGCQGDLLNRIRHCTVSATGAGGLSSKLDPSRRAAPPSSSGGQRRDGENGRLDQRSLSASRLADARRRFASSEP